MATKKQEVATIGAATELAISSAMSGMEGMQVEDIAIPFISILQTLSPMLKKSNANYNPDAEEGFIFNSVTGEVYPDGITVIPCAYKRNYVEWKPRSAGGGYVAEHDRNSPLLKQCTQHAERNVLITPNGNELVDTANYYVLLVKGEGDSLEVEKAIIAMVSTNLTLARKWNSIMQAKKLRIAGEFRTPPMFAYSYHLSTVQDSNDQGEWSKFKLGESALVEEAFLVQEAIDFTNAIKAGEITEASRDVETKVDGDSDGSPI